MILAFSAVPKICGLPSSVKMVTFPEIISFLVSGSKLKCAIFVTECLGQVVYQ